MSAASIKMEVNYAALHDVILPTAVFSPTTPPLHSLSDPTTISPRDPDWQQSSLNPKNRIDNLNPPRRPLWRIDGCTSLGTQFYAIPLFDRGLSPMRFDVFVPDTALESSTTDWHTLLDLGTIFHAKDPDRINRLGITAYVLQVLQCVDVAKVRQAYDLLPFGSRIVLERLELDPGKTKVTFVPTHFLEHQQLSINTVGGWWNVDVPSVDIGSLVLVRQLQDSVCLVRWRSSGEAQLPEGKPNASPQDALFVMKALTSGLRYMYHELRTLLSIRGQHSSLNARPLGLVVKKNKWVPGKLGVVGFLQHFYPGGGLRDQLPLLRLHGRLHPADQYKWALQMTTALRHINTNIHDFYSDMRLDNIVLDENGDAILVDFEQRGVWTEFSAPEINAIENIRVLASEEDEEELNPQTKMTKDRYRQLLDNLLPEWRELQDREEYTNPPQGYNIPWLCLSPREREAAQVYMLGRLLWCIFEGMCAPQRGAIWQSYRREPEFEFPEYRLTPMELRCLIDQCTIGRRESLGRLITREGSRLVLRGVGGDGGGGEPSQIRDVAREWWRKELGDAEEFLIIRRDLVEVGNWDETLGRPSLEEVEVVLRRVEAR